MASKHVSTVSTVVLLLTILFSAAFFGGIIWAAAALGGLPLALYAFIGILVSANWVRRNGSDMALWGVVVILLWPLYIVNFSSPRRD